jgi:hypothetical protein
MTYRINFDYELGKNNTSSAVTFPKIYQGAPYNLPFKVKNTESGAYRDFSSISNIRLIARTSTSATAPLFTANKSSGHFSISPDGLTINFTLPANLCSSISSSNNTGVAKIDEIPFVYSIEFLDTNNVVTEIFAMGTGFVVLNPSR